MLWIHLIKYFLMFSLDMSLIPFWGHIRVLTWFQLQLHQPFHHLSQVLYFSSTYLCTPLLHCLPMPFLFYLWFYFLFLHYFYIDSSIKQFVVTNCGMERPGPIVAKTLKSGILIPIVTSKESNFNADFKYISVINISYTHQKLRAWETLPHFRK